MQKPLPVGSPAGDSSNALGLSLFACTKWPSRCFGRSKWYCLQVLNARLQAVICCLIRWDAIPIGPAIGHHNRSTRRMVLSECQLYLVVVGLIDNYGCHFPIRTGVNHYQVTCRQAGSIRNLDDLWHVVLQPTLLSIE